ncbi:glycosyltransferase [Burkholderia sp. NFPP32]|uniref:glycosyltransferase family 2 protein n=1 Tax=Burkholderia sp. NFPP32 TaxID=1566267 RepID=UPI001C435881|nr:glycosyltransferase [Burkholderia sp. NFPP32]
MNNVEVRLLERCLSGYGRAARAMAAVTDAIRRHGITGTIRKVIEVARRDASYRRWVAAYDVCGAADRASLASEIKCFRRRPLISIVVPVYNTPVKLLIEMIESVRAQVYPHWELCIADDASSTAQVREVLERYQTLDRRVRVVFRERNGHICVASNSALELATGEFIALLDHDDILPPHALAVVARYINAFPDAKLFYSDEDKISMSGERSTPYFKTDWDPELIRQQNFFSHFGVFAADVVRSVGGFRRGLEGSQDHDLVLRCAHVVPTDAIVHIPHILYHWRTVKGSTATGVAEKPYAVSAAVRAVTEYLASCGVDADVIPPDRNAPLIEIRYALPNPPPRVHLVVLAGARAGVGVARLAERLLGDTQYINLCATVIVEDVAQVAAEVRAHIAVRGESAIDEVVRSDGAEFICLIDASMVPADATWLDRLVRQALQPHIGLVAPMICARNGTLLATGAVMCTPTRGVPAQPGRVRGEYGYFGRMVHSHTVSALAATCFVVRRTRLDEVGGLRWQPDQSWLNDLAIRVAMAGMRNTVVPRSVVYAAALPPSPARADATDRHPGFADPFYSTNLTLDTRAATYRHAFPPRRDVFSSKEIG